jgi:hypothetical protein
MSCELIESEPSQDAHHRDLAIWEAINAYAEACGGDTSRLTISDRRMHAVAAVERAVAEDTRQARRQELIILALREALNAVQVRIALVGHPQEPRTGHGWPAVSRPDWSKEMTLIDAALTLAQGGA